jgi:hypothetical protein
MLNVEVDEVLPGVTDAGEKLPVAPVGRPVADNATAFEKVPFCAATVMVYMAVPPG